MSISKFNREDLMKILPHRDGMLILDRATLEDETAMGEKDIKGDEWFLQGHFPDNPIVPGVILCEILAQSTCVLIGSQFKEGMGTFLTGFEKVRYKHPVTPGNTFRTQCKIIKGKHPFYWAEGKGYVGDKLAVSAEFSFMITEPK